MIQYLDIFFLIYFIALNGTYGLLIALAIPEIINRNATKMPEFDTIMLAEPSTPAISILTPAFNEENNIIESVRAFLQIQYPNLQIIVINDGSTDQTLQKLKDRFELTPINLVVRTQLDTQPIRGIYQSRTDNRLWVVDKENGGKSDALNVGLNVCQTPLICSVDADSLVDRYALLRMVEPYLYDDKIIAVGGAVHIANGCHIKDGIIQDVGIPKSWLARFQVVEYLRSFLFARMGFNRLGGSLIVSGAFGLFLRDALVDVGGYESDTIGEDMELVVRLHHYMRKNKRPYVIKYIPDPVCYTEAPETVRVLGHQRDRWQRGLAEALWQHKAMLLNPRYGLIGMVLFPIFVFFELLGPIAEFSGYFWFLYAVLTGGIDLKFALLYFLVAIFLGILLSIQSILLDAMSSNIYRGMRLRLLLILVAFLEYFGYRQLTLYFRLKGLWSYLMRKKSWGKMTRKGFQEEEV